MLPTPQHPSPPLHSGSEAGRRLRRRGEHGLGPERLCRGLTSSWEFHLEGNGMLVKVFAGEWQESTLAMIPGPLRGRGASPCPLPGESVLMPWEL